VKVGGGRRESILGSSIVRSPRGWKARRDLGEASGQSCGLDESNRKRISKAPAQSDDAKITLPTIHCSPQRGRRRLARQRLSTVWI